MLRRQGTAEAPSPAAAGSTPGLDPITGLPGRNHLHEYAIEAVHHSHPESTRAVVAFVYIGLLRDVNDSYGADAGDRLLRLVGDRLGTIDLPNTRVIRHEGAEFALVFEGILHYEMAEEVARFIIELLTPGFDIGTDIIGITPTVGAALSTDNYASIDDFIRDAHQALVRARDEGPGAYALHDESKRGRYETRIDESRLRSAMENEEFMLVYQPIVRVDTDQVIGVEALLRWKAPGATNTGMLFPRDFMPLLEKSGLGVRVGEWVVHEACRQAAQWNDRFPDRPALFVTCNVGARQMADTGFRDQVVDAISSSGVQPWQLCLDITEQALRFNRSSAWAALRELKDMGVKLGLDDFGTGVSSFTYLREFTLDLLRVDRLFVEGVTISKEDRAIIKHIVGLAHDLGLVAVAEGVENAEQAATLKKLGVDLAQGFYYGRPISARDTTLRLDPDAKIETDGSWETKDVLDYDQ
jgi:diguanylate cyclase (GGDEF)-like protein